MNQLLLYLIIGLHFFFVLFVVLTPFIGNNYLLLLHAVFVPFMMIHWYINDNDCFLTLMERQLRLKLYGTVPDPNDCFTYNLIAPIYDFKKNNNDMSFFIYVITIGLWLTTVFKIYSNYQCGKLSKIEDLFLH